MSPVELGAAMNIDEDHHGGRTTTNNSMHTLGLAADIRYIKNPWVAGQHDNEGKPNESRNNAFETVTRNVSRLLGGTDEVLTAAWLHSLASDPAGTSVSAYNEIQKRQTSLQVYLGLQNDTDALKSDDCTPAPGAQARARHKGTRDRRGSRCEMAQDYPGRSQEAPSRLWFWPNSRSRLHEPRAHAGVRSPGSRLPGVGRDRSGIERQRRHDALRLSRDRNRLEAVSGTAANGGRQSPVRESDGGGRSRGRGDGDASHDVVAVTGCHVPRRTALDIHVEYAADADRRLLPQGDQLAQDRRSPGVRAWPSRSVPARAQDHAGRSHHRRSHSSWANSWTPRAARSCSSSRSWIGRISRRTT